MLSPADIKQTSQAHFARDVVEASQEKPVCALFCRPADETSQTLLAAINARADGKKCQLVWLDAGKAPDLLQRLQVEALPALFAFREQKITDGFFGVLPPALLDEFFFRLTGEENSAASLLQQGRDALAAGDATGAADAFAQALARWPESPDALAGLAQAYIRNGSAAQAQALLDQSAADKNHPALAQIIAQLALAQTPAGDEEEFRAALARDEKNYRARYDLALALNARGEKEQAAAQLLAIIGADPGWDDNAAKNRLLEFFAAWGADDPATLAARRKLASLLFR